MKRPKDRLHRVIIIGATPAGITAANKLGELGIPVTLTDTDPDMDQKLARSEWRLPSGMPFNHAHRPGLIRIIRNPSIQCIMPAEITSVKHTPQGFRVRLKQRQVFVDPDRCTLCGNCIQACPVPVDSARKAVFFESQRSLPGRAIIDKRQPPLCQERCPLGVNVQGYLALTRSGKYAEALALIRQDNVLPGICGRVCTRPCEAVCRRSDLDESVSIREIKRFLADQEVQSGVQTARNAAPATRKEKIAVVGSGPAGLAAAADLAKYGFSVSVFEKDNLAGGLLRYGIGSYRLPDDVLERELDYIRSLGVVFITGSLIDPARDIENLKKSFNAVLLATGTCWDRMLGAPGEELEGVWPCLKFLRKIFSGELKSLPARVAIIGGGNSAIDAARAAVRLGAKPTILYRRRQQDMPADAGEIREALEEGVKIQELTQVVSFCGRNGKVEQVKCIPTRPGKPDSRGIPQPLMGSESEAFFLNFDIAVAAIGQTSALAAGKELAVSADGLIMTGDDLCTSIPGVYAAGDAVSGPSSVVEAMANGRTAARSVAVKLGAADALPPAPVRPKDRPFPDIAADIPFRARPTIAERQPAMRKKDFLEVSLGLSEPQVKAESERCLQCGVCSQCLLCTEVCGEVRAIRHQQVCEESVEQAGVLIIADPRIVPPIKGDDVIRIYSPQGTKTDVNAMMVRGFAAAARAMSFLENVAHRPRGHAMAFSQPEPALLSQIRLGVFACRCNRSMGWVDGMDAYIESLNRAEEVVHAEVVNAACVPETSAYIVKTVMQKGITRLVLASCVCCPLNFVCSACTDQRSRLKHALFSGTGISRSMVEACNLRGEVLRIIAHDPELALNRFIRLMNRSVKRAKRLKTFTMPARNYNFTTAVIGGCESALHSAGTLARAGLDVVWLESGSTLPRQLQDYPNLTRWEHASVRELSGTLGDFRIRIQSEGSEQIMLAGAVIIGERARKNIQYIHQEGLPGISVGVSIQESGRHGIPFVYPGSTAVPGLFLADPPGIQVSKRQKGEAAAVLAAAIMPRGPRQSKGFTVHVDENLCRGCGRCLKACPYQAITLKRNDIGIWTSTVDVALCKGCGNCISVCPTGAADSPYRNQVYLEQMLEEVLENSDLTG